jgi:hypothetical protein
MSDKSLIYEVANHLESSKHNTAKMFHLNPNETESYMKKVSEDLRRPSDSPSLVKADSLRSNSLKKDVSSPSLAQIEVIEVTKVETPYVVKRSSGKKLSIKGYLGVKKSATGFKTQLSNKNIPLSIKESNNII